MRCLVTGGAGFIGTALTNRLVQEGHHVRVLDDLSAGDPGRLHPDAVFTRGDVRDRPKLWTLLQKVDCVFHLAARVSVQESVLYPREYNDVNVGGTVSLDDVLAGGVLTGTLVGTGAPWPQDVPEARQFVVRYRAVSNGAEPGPYAWATYQAAQMLFDAIARAPDRPTRRAAGVQLAAQFDAHGALPDVPVTWYRVETGGLPALLRR